MRCTRGTHHLGKEPERLEVFEDVGGLGCDQDSIELLERLVDVAHRVRLDERVLLALADKLRERGEQALDARALDVDKLPRQDDCQGVSCSSSDEKESESPTTADGESNQA